MPARLIDGRAAAADLRAGVAERVAALGFVPGLAVVLVGDDPASAVYVRSKDRAAQAAGIAARTIRLPATTTQAALHAVLDDLNRDRTVDGILLQLPLPAGLDPAAAIAAIDPAKDVDGLTAINRGRLQDASGGAIVPCTPAGVMHLLAREGVVIAGMRALVLGRSALVGRPLATLLSHADATVTLAHSRTSDLPAECRRAGLLIVAVGRPEMVRGDWIAPRAVVIDVGINRLPDGRLVGDVAFDEAEGVAALLTPVPGGVGPMTIACLLENTLIAAVARRG